MENKDWLGHDGFGRIAHEAKVLRSLLRCGLPVPSPLREFTERGNRYLVLEKIAVLSFATAKSSPASDHVLEACNVVAEATPTPA